MHSARAFSSRTWLTVGVIGIILLVAFAFVREYVRNIDIATELDRMEAENAALNTQHLASLQLIAQLSTETAVEAESRTKLNLAKEGETMYVVEDGATDSETDMTDNEVDMADVSVGDDPSLSNPVKWFYYFFAPESPQETGTL
mgnify:CR=1 FL=1